MDHNEETLSSEATLRKAYETPALTDFGSVAEITQGTFAGSGVDNTVYS